MLDYGKWLPGEPTNANGNEKCGMIFAFNGMCEKCGIMLPLLVCMKNVE